MSEQQVAEPEQKQEGLLQRNLNRSDKDILRDRGEIIIEDLDLAYRREIEDLIRKITRKQRKQRNQFDFSPKSTQSLVLTDDFHAEDIKDRDIGLTLEIRNLRVKLHAYIHRFNELHGETYRQIDVNSYNEIKLEDLKI